MKWTIDDFTGKRFGKYEVLCRLAIGGMAEIFLGFAKSGVFVGRPVVIKRILHEQREDPNALQMLLDEARMTATLSHPNVAQVIDLEADGEEILLVIEFIAGATIAELVEAFGSRQELVPLGLAINLIREAAQGLGHAHGHKNPWGESLPIIHRDVTPRNVMMDFEGATKVLDFGNARLHDSERRTKAGMVRGTTAYMSPEQAVGKKLDPRTDLFSLGIIFHELLTGQRLFYKGNPAEEMAAVYEDDIPLPSKLNRRVSKTLDAVVMKMLERKVDKRYQSALDLIRDLSLAASSTAWGKERCAEVMRERFSDRKREIEKLLGRIPALRHFDDAARTVVGMEGLGGWRPPAVEPSARGTDPAQPAMLPWVAPAPPAAPPAAPPRLGGGLGAAELFEDSGEVQTRIISGSLTWQPARSAEVAVPDGLLPAGSGERASGGSSWVRMAAAALVAGLLGAAGGALMLHSLQPPPVLSAVVHLTLTSDRPASVWLGSQALGSTPVSAFVPAGRYIVQLSDEAGPRRSLELNLDPSQSEAKVAVRLDSLPSLP